MRSERAPVIVAGAGPAGLFLACELRRRGVECTIVERNAGPSPHSKALAIMPKTMRLFENAGIAQEFAACVNPVHALRLLTPHRSTRIDFAGLKTPFSFVGILPQWKTEELLTRRLIELGGHVRYGHELERLENCDTGVRAIVNANGVRYAVQADYAAGCDGVHSTVRRESQIGFPGKTYHQQAFLADALVKTSVARDEALIHLDRNGMLTLFPISAEIRRIVVVAPRETVPPAPDAQWLQSRVDRCAGLDVRVTEIAWAGTFHVHRRVAERMRSGNAVLAGDAAHAHSPVGGQGMNTGLHDAFALARALTDALHGDGTALAAYERERLAAARRVVRKTDALTRALVHPNPVMSVGREYLAPYVIGITAVRERVVRSLLTA